jgi:cytoskeleton protein RodZ
MKPRKSSLSSAIKTGIVGDQAAVGAESEPNGVEQMAFFENAMVPAAAGAVGMMTPLVDPSEQAVSAEVAEEATSPASDSPEQVALFPESLTQRLVAAREARGWNRADVAARLRLPERVVESIETERFDAIGQAVYLRGYLNSYARLVGVPSDAVEAVLHTKAAPPPELVATGRISHSRYLVERYSRFVPYLGLTAVIFVPLVWNSMNMGGNVGTHLTPLDAPVVATTEADVAADTLPVAPAPVAVTETAKVDAQSPVPASAATDAPVMASFAMVPSSSDPSKSVAAPAAERGQLRLSLTEASWVEIVDADGKRLEYSTLPAGTVKEYPADKSLTILLGNTTGAKIDVGGQTQDIAPYVRGNVAKFKLGAGGKSISSTNAEAAQPHNG